MSRTTSDYQQGDMFALLEQPAGEPCGHCGKATLPDDMDSESGCCWHCVNTAEEHDTATVEAEAELAGNADIDDDENERGEVIDQREAERQRWEAYLAKISVSQWEEFAIGHTRPCHFDPRRSTTSSKGAGCVVRIANVEGVWSYSPQHTLKNGGSSSPWSETECTSRESVIEHIFTRELEGLARTASVGRENAESARWLAERIIEAFPPLLYGFDLRDTWEAALAYEQLDRACVAAYRRKRDFIGHRAGRALRDLAMGSTFRGPEQGPIYSGDGERPEEWRPAGEHIGWWCIEGTGDDMFLTLIRYDKHEDNPIWDWVAAVLKQLKLPCTVMWRVEPLNHYGQQCAFGWVRYGKDRRTV